MDSGGLHWILHVPWESMTHYDDAPEETEDRFYAQFDSREVKLMTLDELVTAFEAGEIHENTFVCREGESEWLTLAIVALIMVLVWYWMTGAEPPARR